MWFKNRYCATACTSCNACKGNKRQIRSIFLGKGANFPMTKLSSAVTKILPPRCSLTSSSSLSSTCRSPSQPTPCSSHSKTSSFSGSCCHRSILGLNFGVCTKAQTSNFSFSCFLSGSRVPASQNHHFPVQLTFLANFKYPARNIAASVSCSHLPQKMVRACQK